MERDVQRKIVEITKPIYCKYTIQRVGKKGEVRTHLVKFIQASDCNSENGSFLQRHVYSAVQAKRPASAFTCSHCNRQATPA